MNRRSSRQIKAIRSYFANKNKISRHKKWKFLLSLFRLLQIDAGEGLNWVKAQGIYYIKGPGKIGAFKEEDL